MSHHRITCFLRLLGAIVPAVAVAAPAGAQGFYAGAGSSVYSSDEFCLSTAAALSGLRAGFGGDAVGASVAYNNEDWPWIPPPGGGGSAAVVPGFAAGLVATSRQEFYQARGEAFQAVVELFPLGLLPGLKERSTELRRYLSPFIGVGVMIAGDGDPAPASQNRPLPTYGVKGGTDVLIAYGASLRVPVGVDPLRLLVQFRGTSVFARGTELVGPAGDVLETGDPTLTWGEWMVGFAINR
ncbi:MAG: hypothetical protein L0271_25365 [Gemmatimonadetes bacterium]|nr:hypothetical protein [Gemmatimonadota bacterium]